MKVLMLIPSLNVEKFKGVARYGYEIYQRVKKKIDVEVHEIYKGSFEYFDINYVYNLGRSFFKEVSTHANVIHSTIAETGAFLWIVSKLKNVKTIVTFHDLIPLKAGKTFRYKYLWLIKPYSLFMWKNAIKSQIVVAQSSLTARNIEKYLGRKADEIIPPGIDKKFRPMSVKKDKITLGFFSNFSYRKGLDKAVEVFKIVKQKYDVKLIIAGGSLKTNYQREFNPFELTKGLNDVEILGEIKEEDVVKLYNSFDFFLFPSLMEGFGIPILEAQACGVPTLIFDYAEIAEEASKKTIKCKNVKDMANKIIELIENREEWLRIRREGIRYAKQFDWDRSAERYIRLYTDG